VARTSYAAMLRGINVGGKNKLAMSDLHAAFEAIGIKGVRTYIQSGNAVFATPKKGAAVATALEDYLRSAHGLEVPVTLRSKEELATVIRRNPFVKQGRATAELHVSFLTAAPARPALAVLEAKRKDPDEYVADGAHLYLWCPAGYGNASLTNPVVERCLKVGSTTRNWRTVTTLSDMANED
jgi:uncharacterized protein (DUF1697 family)